MTQGKVVRSTLPLKDLLSEAFAGILARPARAFLTTLGTILGVGAFVAVLGLTTTVAGQISERFTVLVATEVVVEDVGTPDPGSDTALIPNAFPADADGRVQSIDGVNVAGVWWPVRPGRELPVAGVPVPGRHESTSIPVVAASPGLLRAIRPTIGNGRLFDPVHDGRSEHVAVLGSAAARQLGIADLSLQPAIFIDGIPFSVVGVVDNLQRQTDLLFSIIIPRRTAETLWGAPDGASTSRAKMLIDTRVGAAQVVARQVAMALRPDAPASFRVIPPPDPRELREGVATDLTALFLTLAAVCLVIGAIGIANTTMVSVLERIPEIGLRRSLGARRRHIAAQFLAESGTLGAAGGLVGTSLGVLTVLTVALIEQWTPILPPWLILTAPAAGTFIGVLAGAYPALRAAFIEPAEAVRR